MTLTNKNAILAAGAVEVKVFRRLWEFLNTNDMITLIRSQRNILNFYHYHPLIERIYKFKNA